MTCKTLFTASLVLVALSGIGQNVRLGVRAGYSSSNVVVKASEYYRPLRGFHAGADAHVPLGGRFALNAGLQYSRKGAYHKYFTDTGLSPEVGLTFHYIAIPLAFDYRLWHGLSVQGGLEAAVLVAARGRYAGDQFKFKLEDQYEDFDLGLLAGLEWRFGRGFYVGARQIWGIMPVERTTFNNEKGVPIAIIRSYNRAWQLSAGYRFSL